MTDSQTMTAREIEATIEAGTMHVLDDVRGIYIPRDWYAECFTGNESAYTDSFTGEPLAVKYADDLADLTTPDNEYYWDSWTTITDNARYTDDQGIVWTLYQSGSLYYIREDVLDIIPEDWWNG